ncbi:MAG TPA: TrkH family potassium uptake protein [Spirochaetia bacterium]|nr:TrkH family potassium uptake protein [Spirochaetales bacterium]HRY81720.1 TrkH family potassium uptake protein [Spirochaetia bacterium]HRZ87962.1 TrkH family potassium uptake protein [Spirochaetia bacterium]
MREVPYLGRRYAAIAYSIGVILVVSGAIQAVPILAAVWYPEETARIPAFLVPAGIQTLLGLALGLAFRSRRTVELNVREGGVIIVVGWTIVILFSAWPFTAVLGLPFSRSVFESVSGWTTTGLSVVDVLAAGPAILLWRSVMQLSGGAGLAVIMMSAVIGPAGTGISSAEGRGDQLVPQVKRSARLVLTVYLSYAAAGIAGYRLAGMGWFDAINHSFAAVSTGGFSTRVESVGHWDSAAIEAVTLPLMILGNLSFVTAWHLFRGRLRTVGRNGEIRLLAVVIPASVTLAFLFTTRELYPRMDKAFRVAVFEVVTAITTTGFSTVGYGNWNSFGVFLIVILMLIGGGTCSTAGGIKQSRVYLLWKALVRELRTMAAPRRAVLSVPYWEGERRVFLDDGKVRQVAAFVVLYLVTYAAGTLVLCACGFGLTESLFEFASALGTVGLSVGLTGANMPDAALWAETLAMFLGRLELTIVFVSLAKIGTDARNAFARHSR